MRLGEIWPIGILASMPFRRVAVGAEGVEEFPRPFLSLRLSKTSPVAATDDDKLLDVSMSLRVVADVTDADGQQFDTSTRTVASRK